MSKLRPQEQTNLELPVPFEAEPPAFVGSSELLEGSESLGVAAASLLLPLGFADVMLEESLVAIGVEIGMSASSDCERLSCCNISTSQEGAVVAALPCLEEGSVSLCT